MNGKAALSGLLTTFHTKINPGFPWKTAMKKIASQWVKSFRSFGELIFNSITWFSTNRNFTRSLRDAA
jgi:hypothetical protein